MSGCTRRGKYRNNQVWDGAILHLEWEWRRWMDPKTQPGLRALSEGGSEVGSEVGLSCGSWWLALSGSGSLMGLLLLTPSSSHPPSSILCPHFSLLAPFPLSWLSWMNSKPELLPSLPYLYILHLTRDFQCVLCDSDTFSRLFCYHSSLLLNCGLCGVFAHKVVISPLTPECMLISLQLLTFPPFESGVPCDLLWSIECGRRDTVSILKLLFSPSWNVALSSPCQEAWPRHVGENPVPLLHVPLIAWDVQGPS